MANTDLIMPEEFFAYQNIADDGSSHPNIEKAIEYASALLVKETGREFLQGTADEIFHGNGKYRYWLTHKRILAEDAEASPAIAAPVIYYYANTASGTNWTESTDSWEYNTDKGYVWWTDPYCRFTRSTHRPNWRITYTYGWAQEDLPTAIRHVCARLAHLILKQAEKQGLASEGFADSTTTYDLNIPSDLRDAINGYRSPRMFE